VTVVLSKDRGRKRHALILRSAIERFEDESDAAAAINHPKRGAIIQGKAISYLREIVF